MKGTCEDCNSTTRITLAPYGMRFMAEIACPKCGVSYDTNLDDADIEKIKESLLKTEKVTAVSELEILRAEYEHAQKNPLFDDPSKYCVLLDLIQNRIDQIEERYANF